MQLLRLTVQELELALQVLENPEDGLPQELLDLTELEWLSLEILSSRLKQQQQNNPLQ